MNNKNQNKIFSKIFSKIGLKLLIPYLVIAFSSLILLAGILYYSYQTQTIAIQDMQDEISSKTSGEIDSYLSNTIDGLNLLSKNISCVDSPCREDNNFLLRNLLTINPSLNQISVVDISGNEKSKLNRYENTDVSNLGNISTTSVYINSLKNNTYISLVGVSKYNLPYVLAGVPILNKVNEKIGFVIAEVDLSPLWGIISKIKVKETGYVYVVDNSGKLIAYKDIGLVKSQPDLKNIEGVKGFLNNIKGFKKYTSFTGEKVLGNWRSIDLTNWGLIVELPTREIFKENLVILTISIVSLLFSILFIWIIIYLIYINLSVPLSYIQDGIKKIGDGNLNVNLTLSENIKENEIGQLVETINTTTSQLKESYKKINTEKAKLLSSINSIPFGFIIFDKDNNILLKNKVMVDILSMRGSESASLEDIINLFGGDFDISTSIKLCIKTKAACEIKQIIFHNKVFRGIVSPIITTEDNMEIIGFVFMIENVTEARALERSRDEFFSIASHELRTPLTAIRGNSQMLQDGYKDKMVDHDMSEMINDIHESSTRLIGIVNDFLEVSKLEQGKIEIKKEKFDLSEVIVKVIKSLESVASQKDLKLIYIPKTDGVIQVFSDKYRVEQLLFNLIGNSLKFTKSGSVTVEIEPIPNFIKIKVIDTGIGISEQNQTLLFRKFQQAGEQVLARDVTQGTGLGLYICHLLTSKLGGTIDLESSTLGKGSTFVFTLPVSS